MSLARLFFNSLHKSSPATLFAKSRVNENFADKTFIACCFHTDVETVENVAYDFAVRFITQAKSKKLPIARNDFCPIGLRNIKSIILQSPAISLMP